MPDRIAVGTDSAGLLTQREQGVGYVSRDHIAAASLAQLAEQLALNQRVDGSSPSRGISKVKGDNHLWLPPFSYVCN